MLASLISWLSSNPIVALFVAFILVQIYSRSRPFPVVDGSKVKEVNSLEEFKDLVKSSKASKNLIVVDFYATWCPPCRTAAPIYAELSRAYSENDIVFAKVDVDKAKDLSRAENIQAMPTFKIYSCDGEEIGALQGWKENGLKNLITKALNNINEKHLI